MPLFQTQTYSAAATTPSINLDPSITPFNALVACTVTGTASYSLQFSITPFTIPDSAANWFTSTDIPAATSASKTSLILAPLSRIRLVIATLTGGTIVLEVSQGMSTN